MIDQATIDRINEAAHIEEVVSDFVTLRRRGVNLIGLCPFHDEKTPSFTVSPAKGIFKCFGCGKGGNAVHFIMEHEQLSYVDALKYLARKYHIEVKEKERTPEEEAAKNDRESMFLVNDFAQKYFSNILYNHVDGQTIGMAYFRERGFRDDIIKKFQLGYCLDERDAFTKAALKAGYKKDYLVKTGLTIIPSNSDSFDNATSSADSRGAIDRFRGRVMFPVHTLSGKVVAFGGRVLKKDEKTAKYLNSPESEIYHKSNELYGIFFAKQSIVKNDRCYLVEGYTDVISMHQSGIENVVASSGTSLTPGQIRMIHRFTENVTILYDGDAAGIKASIRGIDLLLEEGLNIKVLLLPNGDDPDSFARTHDSSEFIEFIEKNSTDFIHFKTNLLLEDAGNDPIKRAVLIQDIVKSISVIPNQIIRSEYVKMCCSLLNVDEKILYSEINKIKRNGNVQLKQNNLTSQEKKTEGNQHQIDEMIETSAAIRFDREEANLIQTLIKYGSKVLFSEKDENNQTKNTTVGDYILQELENDGIVFANPLHQKMLEEYKRIQNDSSIDFEKYFLNHPEIEISQFTANMITEKYTLSKIHSKFREVETDEKRLDELAPRYIYEFKLALIMNQRKEKLLELKSANENNDLGKLKQLMIEIEQIDRLKNLLSKELDRVLNLL